MLSEKRTLLIGFFIRGCLTGTLLSGMGLGDNLSPEDRTSLIDMLAVLLTQVSVVWATCIHHGSKENLLEILWQLGEAQVHHVSSYLAGVLTSSGRFPPFDIESIRGTPPRRPDTPIPEAPMNNHFSDPTIGVLTREEVEEGIAQLNIHCWGIQEEIQQAITLSRTFLGCVQSLQHTINQDKEKFDHSYGILQQLLERERGLMAPIQEAERTIQPATEPDPRTSLEVEPPTPLSDADLENILNDE